MTVAEIAVLVGAAVSLLTWGMNARATKSVSAKVQEEIRSSLFEDMNQLLQAERASRESMRVQFCQEIDRLNVRIGELESEKGANEKRIAELESRLAEERKARVTERASWQRERRELIARIAELERRDEGN